MKILTALESNSYSKIKTSKVVQFPLTASFAIEAHHFASLEEAKAFPKTSELVLFFDKVFSIKIQL
jgi:hypothetical protein